jgi:selenocysteine lyase/cysteine desulfurase
VLNFADEQSSIESRLKEASIKFDVREHGIRVSPHIYNTDEEIEHLLRCITR